MILFCTPFKSFFLIVRGCMCESAHSHQWIRTDYPVHSLQSTTHQPVLNVQVSSFYIISVVEQRHRFKKLYSSSEWKCTLPLFPIVCFKYWHHVYAQRKHLIWHSRWYFHCFCCIHEHNRICQIHNFIQNNIYYGIRIRETMQYDCKYSSCWT